MDEFVPAPAPTPRKFPLLAVVSISVVVLAAIAAATFFILRWQIINAYSPSVNAVEAAQERRQKSEAAAPVNAAKNQQPEQPNGIPTSVSVPILVYHNIRPAPPQPLSADDQQYEVTPAAFESQMAYLSINNYHSISFPELAAAMRGEKALPQNPVIITLDDGRESQYQNAFPLLIKHRMTATFFVFTNAIDRPDYFTWEQLKEMQKAGMAIESHTRFHPYLTKSSDAELVVELTESKKTLEAGLGTKVSALAYPFGLFDERVVAATRAAGYETARTLRHTTTFAPGSEFLSLGGFITPGNFKQFKAILTSP